MNSVHIIGNITRDVELTYASSGTAIAKIGVAVNKKVKNASGAYEDKPVFIDVTAFGKTAETLNQYFRKGSKIGVDGELNFEQWTAQDGQKRSKLSVTMNRLHFIDKKDDSQQGGQAPQQNYGQQQQPQQQYQPQGQQQYGQPQQQASQNNQAPAQASQPQYNQPAQGQQQQPQQQYQPQGGQAPAQQQQPAYNPQGQAQNPQQQRQPNPNGPQQGQLPQNNAQQAQQPISEDQIPF
jgi:single-strand DNA-binding protein